MIKYYLLLIIKGMGMGAANVIPGVSGGTIALITGIFERLIDAIKSFDLKALQLLLKGKIKDFLKHTDFFFVVAVFAGAFISIFSLAVLLQYLFDNYPVQIWAFFFGLILASVFFVGRTIEKWNLSVIITFILGTTIAVLISILTPASRNDSFIYLIICGVVAICSMILPGLSGSFVLLLMGNYELVMLEAVSEVKVKVLLPVAIGAVGGLIAFSHVLSWVYKKFKDQTIATLTGFILGSLMILWPWKEAVYRLGPDGKILMKEGERVIQGYSRYIPELNSQTIWAIVILFAGVASIWVTEKVAASKN